MDPLKIFLLVIWFICLVVWIVITYLNYGQIKPVIGLRPSVKKIFWIQTIISLLFFVIAFVAIFLVGVGSAGVGIEESF